MDLQQVWALKGVLYIVDPPIHYPIPFSCSRLTFVFVHSNFIENRSTETIPDSMELQDCIDAILKEYFENKNVTWALDAYYKPTTRGKLFLIAITLLVYSFYLHLLIHLL